MIKLTTLIKELDKPKQLYAPGYSPEVDDDSFLEKGYKLGNPKVDPETGTVTTDVINLPKFEELRRQITMMRKEFQPFKFSSNEDISKISKDINTNLTKLSQLIFALDKMIELHRQR